MALDHLTRRAVLQTGGAAMAFPVVARAEIQQGKRHDYR